MRALAREPAEVHAVEELECPCASLRLAHTAEPQRELDVAGSSEPREQRGLLEHERAATGDLDRARGGFVEPGDEVEDRRLAAP